MSKKPDSHPAEKSKIILLSGFLGSGKTTLLKRILSWETDLSDTVVLVNEFGDVGIDGNLLKDSASDVVEMASGCICCTLSNDLRQSLLKIWESFRPRKIFIESSGVADPTAIESVLLDPKISQKMKIDRIVTVLDADYWEARETFGPLFYNQLATAHLILLNKIDLLDKETVPQFLIEIHDVIPNVQVLPTIRCNIDPETLWSQTSVKTTFGLKPIHFFHGEPLSSEDNLHNGNHQGQAEKIQDRRHVDISNYITFSFQGPDAFDETCFKQFVKDLPWELFRMKGFVRFQDQTVFINFVGGKSEWASWERDQETRLAFIGWDIDREDILLKLKDCMQPS
ncbi:MAG: GTP-binding protein [Deltaproteobacteria bacterium]|nr:GTP-binding protein [Deltaproteobacteria bacterium]